MRCCKEIANAINNVAKAIRRPKRNVPAKPVIEGAMENDGAIDVYWRANDEHDDVAEYTLYKDRVFHAAITGPLPLELSYTDKDVVSGVTYKYHIVASQGPGKPESVPSDIIEASLMF